MTARAGSPALPRRLLTQWLPLLAWMAAIYILSDQPDLPRAPDAWLDFLLKKAMHAAAYALLTWLWWRALEGAGMDRPLAWAFLLSLIYAISDEWHQTQVPGRRGQPRDVAIDAFGALAAVAWIRFRHR